MTGRWRPLPGTLAPEVAHLARLLREFKDRSGLSLAALAGKTNYSKSSWERCLNGKALPPRHAVQALAQLAGEPTARPLAMWELAQASWSSRDIRPRAAVKPPSTADDQESGAPRLPSRHRHRLRGWALTAAVLAAAALTRLLGIQAPSFSSIPPGYPAGCRDDHCTCQFP